MENTNNTNEQKSDFLAMPKIEITQASTKRLGARTALVVILMLVIMFLIHVIFATNFLPSMKNMGVYTLQAIGISLMAPWLAVIYIFYAYVAYRIIKAVCHLVARLWKAQKTS